MALFKDNEYIEMREAFVVLRERGRVGAENRVMAITDCSWENAVMAVNRAIGLEPYSQTSELDADVYDAEHSGSNNSSGGSR